jgi:phage terminase Nu1 subunit (DNA packaging protein)
VHTYRHAENTRGSGGVLMRTAKDFGGIPSYHCYPEADHCFYCDGELERSHPVWSKTIITMGEIARVTDWGYRCVNRDTICPRPDHVYRSAMADGLALKGYNYGLDVIVFVGQQRFDEYRTVGEIHQALQEEGVPISERRVTDYVGDYRVLLKCAQGAKLAAYRDAIVANGGVVLAIDGVQPQKGKPTLYIFRDVLSRARLHAASLWHNDTDSLVVEMKVVDRSLNELGVPLLGIISDSQDAIRLGVARAWPDVLHQLCHLHFLKAVQKPVYDEDSSLSKELKKGGVVSAPSSAK